MATIEILEGWFKFLLPYAPQYDHADIMAIYDRGATAIQADPEHWANRSLRDLMYEYAGPVADSYSPTRTVRV